MYQDIKNIVDNNLVKNTIQAIEKFAITVQNKKINQLK